MTVLRANRIVGTLKKSRPGKNPPGNPFLVPTRENCDLRFLDVDPAHLAYAVEHYDRLRRLREGIVFEFINRREHAPGEWEKLVAAASEHFHPESWMLPVSAIGSPALLNGIYDYIPISGTSPELYDESVRALMQANKQRPWLIMMTMNTGRHSQESFLKWVRDELVPKILKSAKEMSQHHFPAFRTGSGEPRRGIRTRMPKRGPAAPCEMTEKRLTARLRALAAYRIRQSALPGETMTRSLERYREALPAGVKDNVTLAAFIRRVALIGDTAREEWKARLGEAALRHAQDNGLVHLA